MIILGVDPGTKITGFGLIKFQNNELSYINSGLIRPLPQNNIGEKLEKIYDELARIIRLYQPTEFSLETAFYSKNVQSTLKIGYVRGISLLVSAHNNLNTFEYSPREIKKSVVGRGNATKEQVQFMIKKLLVIKKEKMTFDESDALAAAICHAFNINKNKPGSSTWKTFIKENPNLIIN